MGVRAAVGPALLRGPLRRLTRPDQGDPGTDRLPSAPPALPPGRAVCFLVPSPRDHARSIARNRCRNRHQRSIPAHIWSSTRSDPTPTSRRGDRHADARARAGRVDGGADGLVVDGRGGPDGHRHRSDTDHAPGGRTGPAPVAPVAAETTIAEVTGPVPYSAQPDGPPVGTLPIGSWWGDTKFLPVIARVPGLAAGAAPAATERAHRVDPRGRAPRSRPPRSASSST